MESIALTVPVRKNSQRVPNKLLRSFADSSLFEIYLDKLEGTLKKYVYVVAYEQEFIDIAKRRGFKIQRRSEESANGETSPVIHSYLKDMDEEIILMCTACCPLMKVSTLKKILEITEEKKNDPLFYGLITVKTCSNVIWDSTGNPVNKDVRLFNTKLRKDLYIETSSIFVYRRKRFLDLGCYWDFSGPKDPSLFVIDPRESLDIDTLFDFEITEILYKRENQ